MNLSKFHGLFFVLLLQIFSISLFGQTYPDTLWVPVTYYDFHSDGSNPEFEPDHKGGVLTGLIHDTLDIDNKPISSETYLNYYIKYWYRDWADSAKGDSTAPRYNSNGDFISIDAVNHDTSFKNIVIRDSLPFLHNGTGEYEYLNDNFFPIDNKGFGNEQFGHNFSFAMELSASFVQRSGLTFDFRGDDDVWAFINGKLVMDLGNMHQATNGAFSTDTITGLAEGETYSFNLFFAERHTYASHIRISTNLLTNQRIKDVSIIANPDISTLLEGDTIALMGNVNYDSTWINVNGDSVTQSLVDTALSQCLTWNLICDSVFNSENSVLSTDSGMNNSFTSSEPNKTFRIIATYKDTVTFQYFKDTLIINTTDNMPPVVVPDSIVCSEGGTVSLLHNGNSSVLANDSDSDIGTTLTAKLITAPSNGILALNSDGTFIYTHDDSEVLSDQFQYTANDGVQDGNTVTVSITINPINDNAPVAVKDSINVTSIGGTATTTVGGSNSLLSNDTDADNPNGGSLTASLLESTNYGTITLNIDGTFSYTHDGSENIVDSLIYIVSDGLHFDTAKVSISINVTFDNKPEANSDTINLTEGGSTSILSSGSTSILANDLSNDAYDELQASIIINPLYGAVAINSNGTFTYTHNGSESFIDSFSYQITDLGNLKDTAIVYISIAPINDNKPVASGDIIPVDVGSSSSQTVHGGTSLLDNDTDLDLPYDSLFANILISPKHGNIILNSNGTFIYTHDGSNESIDSVFYTLSDKANHLDTALVLIAVYFSYNNKPIATNDSIITTEGNIATTLTNDSSSLLSNDYDIDLYDKLNISILSNSIHGSVNINSNGSFTYIHNDSENFTDSFSYVITDLAELKDTGKVYITINRVNDNTPMALNDLIRVEAVGGIAQKLLNNDTSIINNDTDTDLPFDNLTTTLLTNPKHGSLNLNSNGTFRYQHDGSLSFRDTAIYQLRDESGHTASAQLIFLINAKPIATRDSINTTEGYNTIVLANFIRSLIANDISNDFPDTLTASLLESPIHGTATVYSDGTFRYTHNNSESSRDSFTYVITDLAGQKDTGTVGIKISLINDNNPIANPDTINVEQGKNSVILINGSHSILDNDTDIDFHDSITCELFQDVSHGFLTLKENGRFNYIHDGTENLYDEFLYIAIDSGGLTDTGIVSIIIDPSTDIEYSSSDKKIKQRVSFHIVPNITNPGDKMEFVVKGDHENLIVNVVIISYMGDKIFEQEFLIPANSSGNDQIFGNWNGISKDGVVISNQDLITIFKLHSTDGSYLGSEKVRSAIKR